MADQHRNDDAETPRSPAAEEPVRVRPSETPGKKTRTPETEHIEEEGEPFGTNFA